VRGAQIAWQDVPRITRWAIALCEYRTSPNLRLAFSIGGIGGLPHSTASQPLAHYYAACLIDRMDLEDVLCQIKTDCCNIRHGWLPLLVIFDDHHFGTSMP
jgi:hypothetical protein